LVALLTIILGLNIVAGSDTPTINDLKISPELDISYFGRYTVEANITNADTVKIKVTAINGESGNDCWDYYIDGVCASEPLEFDMTWASGDIWKKEYIYPDNIYPEVFFTSSDTTWYNNPSDMLLHRHNYHLFHFINPFQMDTNMSFWIELNAVPRNYSTSAPIEVYVIGKGETTSYFQSEWRTKSNTHYAGSILRTDSFAHNHTIYSSHFVIPLKADTNGKIGGLDVSDDFWIILYNDAEPTQRGWDLKYHNENLYTTQAWYTANRFPSSNWNTPSVQVGSPDVHVHIARRVNIIDGVKIDINATNTSGTTSDSYEFFYTPLPNLPPSKTIFTSPNPELGTYSGQILIEWLPATDANNDPLTYKLVLIRDGIETTLVENTTLTSFSWDSTTVPDGEYDLSLSICDPEICVITKLSDQYVGGFIVANNKPPNAPTIFSIGRKDINSSYIYDEDNGLSNLFTMKGKDNGDPNGDEVQTVWLVSQTFENLWAAPDYNQTWQSTYANFSITDDLRGNGEKDWYFGLLVRDPLGETNSTWWKMTAKNNSPVTFDGALVVIEDTPKSGKLNASDIDGDSLTFSIVANPGHGGISDLNTSSGDFTYTPTSGYFGGDSFTFKVNDGTVDSNVSTVSITVNAENDAPTASNDTYSTDENTPLVVVAPGVLGNDFDVEGDILSAILVDDVDYGTLTLNADGSFTYTPNSDFQGADSFTYKANDGLLYSNIATVTITVENLPPIIKKGVTLPENVLFSNVELTRLVIHTESISIDDTIGEGSDATEIIVVDGIEVYVIELSKGKNTILAQVYNPGFLTQIGVNIRFENLPQGLSIGIDGQSQNIKAHSTGNFILVINVSPEVPKGEYFITAIPSARKGGKDRAIIKIIIN